MAEWIRINTDRSITTVGAHDTTEISILHNQLTNLWEDSDLVIVDGIVTINVDTHNIMGCRIVRANETLQASDFSDTVPEENSPDIWYSWFAPFGGSIFRCPSKFSIFPQYQVWLTVWKDSGPTAATNILVGGRLLVQKK